MKILDPAFWRSLLGPLVRTAVASVSPYVPVIIVAPFVWATWREVGLAVILAMLLAIATALRGLPDTTGPWWEQALQRAARQAGQFAIAAFIPGAAFSAIDWKTLGTNIVVSAITTFILAAASIVQPQAVPKLALVDDTSPEGTEGYTDPAINWTTVPDTAGQIAVNQDDADTEQIDDTEENTDAATATS